MPFYYNTQRKVLKNGHTLSGYCLQYIPFSSQFDSCTVDNSPSIYNPNRKGTAQKWEGKK